MSNYATLFSDDQIPHAPIKAWTKGVLLEDEAFKQLVNIAQMPFIYKHVAVMPDVHAGKGSTVGTVIATQGAVIPAAVGVDIGCGMIAARTNLKASDLPDNLAAMRSAIEAAVPHGRTDNGGPNDKGAWQDGPPDPAAKSLAMTFKDVFDTLAGDDKHLNRAAQRSPYHLGTLGSGNHFIEVCLDEADDVWVMLHSGSRGIGNAIGQHYIEKAKAEMRRWFINLPDVDLAYLPEGSQHFDDYFRAVGVAQEYARMNREVMFNATIKAIADTLGRHVEVSDKAVNCHHNYVTRENHFGKNVIVTRKGAVRAREGDLGIIPGSMGARSYIVRGKGNRESFCSCSHGAGRVMSRTQARNTFTVEDHIKATAGIECRKDIDVLDETPAAYKSIDDVMAAQTDLVDVVARIRQILCVKG